MGLNNITLQNNLLLFGFERGLGISFDLAQPMLRESKDRL